MSKSQELQSWITDGTTAGDRYVEIAADMQRDSENARMLRMDEVVVPPIRSRQTRQASYFQASDFSCSMDEVAGKKASAVCAQT